MEVRSNRAIALINALFILLLFNSSIAAEYSKISYQQSHDSAGDTVVICPTESNSGFTHQEALNCGMVAADICATMFNSQEAVDDGLEDLRDKCFVIKQDEDSSVEITNLSGQDVGGTSYDGTETDETVSLNDYEDGNLKNLIQNSLNDIIGSYNWSEIVGEIVGEELGKTVKELRRDRTPTGYVDQAQGSANQNSSGSSGDILSQLLPLFMSAMLGQAQNGKKNGGGIFGGGGNSGGGCSACGNNPDFSTQGGKRNTIANGNNKHLIGSDTGKSKSRTKKATKEVESEGEKGKKDSKTSKKTGTGADPGGGCAGGVCS